MRFWSLLVKKQCDHCRFFVFLLFNRSSVDNGSLANSWSNWWESWFFIACLSLKSLFNCLLIFLFSSNDDTSVHRIHHFFKDYVMKLFISVHSINIYSQNRQVLLLCICICLVICKILLIHEGLLSSLCNIRRLSRWILN